MLIDTRSALVSPTNSANSTTSGTSIANPSDTLAVPSGDGVIRMGADPTDSGGGGMSANGLMLIPFGVGSDGNTFLMSAFAWAHVPIAPNRTGQYTAFLLASFTCTLSSSLAGVANGAIPATSFYCKTITINAGNSNVSVEVVSPGTEKAHVVLDAKGARFIEVRFAMNASATSANALYMRL